MRTSRRWLLGIAAALTFHAEGPLGRAQQTPSASIEVESGALTLADVERFALDHHPTLSEAGSQIEVARGKAWQSGLYPNPVWYVSSPQWAGNISQYNTYFGQDFVTGGKLKLDQRAAQHVAWQSEWESVQARQNVLQAVRQAFIGAVVADRRLAVYQQMLTIAEKSSSLGEALLKAGEISQADVLALETEAQLALTNLENAEVQRIAARRKLAATTGVPHWNVPDLKADLQATLPEYQEDQLRAMVLTDHSESQRSRIEIERTGLAYQRACREVIPNFNLQAGYQYSADRSTDLNHQGYFQFAMVVPIWNRNQGNIHSAENDISRASAALKRVEVELSQQVTESMGRYGSAGKVVKRYENEVLPRARRVLKLNQQLFQQGQTDFLRLFQAQRSLAESELKFIEAQGERWQAAAVIANLARQEQFP